MPDDLATLESERSQILEQFLGLGDLRPGSITAVVRRCGKPSCHCAKPHAPGHDPHFRLTRRAAGTKFGRVRVPHRKRKQEPDQENRDSQPQPTQSNRSTPR